MEHARNMALVDPRLLDTLRSPPPPATDTLGKKVQALDDDMKTILDRKDLDDGTKVTLYNQVLQRYNVLADKHVKEPILVVTVNESMSGPGSGVEPGPGSEGAVRAPSSGLEATVLDTVPKTMQAKARRLMEHLKRDVAWTARAVEWNIPCPPHPPNHARLCRHWLAGTTYKVARCVSVAVFVMPTDTQDAYRSVVAAIFCSGLYLIAHGIAQILMQQTLFRLWYRY